MKPTRSLAVCILLGSALAGLGADAPAPSKTNSTATANAEDADAELRNWVEFGVGGVIGSGSTPAFQRRWQMRRGAPFGGIEDFHFEQDVGKRGLFSIDGRGIFDNHDYDIQVGLTQPEQYYVKAGYRQFRTWYNGSGGFFPVNGQWFTLYNEDFSVDRGEAWLETGLTLPSWPEIRFRFSHEFRNGQKDSTSWGDTSLTGLPPPNNIRNIVPTFWDIDERRELFEGDLNHSIGDFSYGLGLRYEISQIDDSLNIHRRPGEAADRFVTQKEDVDTDIFNVHGFVENRFTDAILVTAGYSFTTLDTDISGSRIYGSDYDPVYDPLFARRQFRDEGFLNLGGGSQLKQHVGTISAMLTPWDNVTIVPAIRIERQDQDGIASFLETDVGAGPAFAPLSADIENTRSRGFTDVSQALEVRYTRLTNWAFYVRGDWLEGEGNLQEREQEAQTGIVFRDTDSTRFTQKYTAGANWYPLRRLNMGAQYYYKSRRNDYDNLVDSTSNLPTSADRYPAYIVDQDFFTHDVNYRVTWRVLANLTLITRYDFQLSTIKTRQDFLEPVQSAESTAHILSESVSWTPFARLFLQASVNYVLDQTDTPAAEVLPGIILNSKNNYLNGNCIAGFAFSDKTDFQAQYAYYRANNYVDNALFSQPYGASGQDHAVFGTLTHRFSRRMQMSWRYGFFAGHDVTSGDHNDFTAHLFMATLRYHF